MRWALISENGAVTAREDEPTLEALQQAVGGYIEAVELNGATMFCNEDGKLSGLPLNEAATFIARRSGAIRTLDAIVGNAVLTGEPDSNGDITDLDEAWLRRALDTL